MNANVIIMWAKENGYNASQVSTTSVEGRKGGDPAGEPVKGPAQQIVEISNGDWRITLHLNEKEHSPKAYHPEAANGYYQKKDGTIVRHFNITEFGPNFFKELKEIIKEITDGI